MKTISVELPDQIARDVEEAVKAGSFATSADVMLAAVREFLSSKRYQLIESRREIFWL
jgi:Arc/MetJ-type ribon-helix-helix transcriptional regulator